MRRVLSRIRLAINLVALAAFTVALTVFANGCATAAAVISAGITGRAELGPTCPVQQPHKTCMRPYQTTLVVYSAAHHRRVKQLRTDRHGRFHIDVAPGHYIIAARTHARYPTAREVRVTVRPHQVTRVTISFDTGIR